LQPVIKKYDLTLLEVSALENKGIEDMFVELARSVIDQNIVKEEEEDEDEVDVQSKKSGGFGTRLLGMCGCAGRDRS
jgi:hypothetical protein